VLFAFQAGLVNHVSGGAHIKQGPKNTTVSVGDQVWIGCSAIGDDNITYTWSKDGVEIGYVPFLK